MSTFLNKTVLFTCSLFLFNLLLMPAGMAFNIEATMNTSIEAAVSTYNDVDAGHTNADAIGYLSARGAIQGYADGNFKPDQAVNRAEALKIILLGGSISVAEDLTITLFPDVPEGGWYTRFVAKAHAMGVVQGNPDGTFRPATTLNLAEALKIVLETKGIDTSSLNVSGQVYTDVQASAWYAPYALYAKNKNLIEADAQGLIHPSQDMTRGTLVELMYRLSVVQENNLEAFPSEEGESSTPESNDDSSSDTSEEPSEETVLIEVEAGDYYFAPDTITIQSDQDVELQFTAVSGFHNFIIDELGITVQLETDGSTTVDLSALEPGIYTYYCGIGNHRALGMEGTLIVE